MRAVGHTDRCAGARNLLHGHAMMQIAEAGTAILLLHRDAVQAERTHLRPQIAREGIVAVDGRGARRDAVLREIVHGFTQHFDVEPEAEIEARPGIGNHHVVSAARLRARLFLVAHDLHRKPVSTFRDHALRRRLYRLALTLSAPRRATACGRVWLAPAAGQSPWPVPAWRTGSPASRRSRPAAARPAAARSPRQIGRAS